MASSTTSSTLTSSSLFRFLFCWLYLVDNPCLFLPPATAFLSPKLSLPPHLACVASSSSRQQLSTLFRTRATTVTCSKKSDNEESDSNDGVDNGSGSAAAASDLSWLKDAMDAPSVLEPDGLVLMETQQGISGFSVDPQRGFVVVLVGQSKKGRATYAVISPKDKQEVRSVEALTLVQLAGGLDLGTPILPPDILAKLVADEISGDTRELRKRVKLLRVDVVSTLNSDNSVKEEEGNQSTDVTANEKPNTESTPERDNAILSQGAKVAEAIRKLPGLEECTFNQVTDAMKLHANADGQLDRQGFTQLLHTLRTQINEMEPSKVQFNLVVAVAPDNKKQEKIQELCIPAPSSMIGVGLALRYKVQVVLSEQCQVEGFDVVEIASRFPAFRPLKHLEEDARIMDGFIPQMFNEASAPNNDDKM